MTANAGREYMFPRASKPAVSEAKRFVAGSTLANPVASVCNP